MSTKTRRIHSGRSWAGVQRQLPAFRGEVIRKAVRAGQKVYVRDVDYHLTRPLRLANGGTVTRSRADYWWYIK